MHTNFSWLYNEFKQVGKDYTQQDEVDVYESSHSDFRNLEAENEAILNILEPENDHVIIDIGAGTGAFAIQAASRCTKVIAIDVSQQMLDYAKAKAQKAAVSNVDFRHSGFLTYQHTEAPVDAVVSNLSLHHLPDLWKGIALRRIYEMLRFGGKLVIRDVIVEDVDPLKCIDAFISQQAERGGDFLREDAEQHFREEFSTFDWVMEELIARAGFSIESKKMEDGIFGFYLCAKT